ncbi:PadR family transcriptional regulator [Paenibacillus sp. P46E]|uniref:PadR family transcriptional regulator n=1 Tax=Paenibacillus sp. P46E TaxID=1349436 RepID=UPI00093DF616|nr:PadR family transcriptional regulator [Paenibacillus sp. P46E]OKP95150.1 PadR family transcriptional regulator [Paenibacillus sp. P46E]
MGRDKYLPLTETVYYILLALHEPAHGYLILQKVEELSGGQVRMAAGTLYGAIENLIKLRFIEPVGTVDNRRKVYVITEEGRAVMCRDYERMNHMMEITRRIWNSDGREPYAEM